MMVMTEDDEECFTWMARGASMYVDLDPQEMDFKYILSYLREEY